MSEDLVLNNSQNKYKYESNHKQWLGFAMLIISLLSAVFCIFPRFLNLGYFLYRIFGYNIWVILSVVALCSIALMKRLPFTAGKKYIVFILLSYLSVLSLMHLIFATNELANIYLDFSDMKGYLSSAYNLTHGITIGGASLSIFVFIVRGVMGVVGSYVVYVITSAIFIGLTIDFCLYNRAIERRKNLYSLKTKKELENKLMGNAKTINDDLENMPKYSFMPTQSHNDEPKNNDDYNYNNITETINESPYSTFNPFDYNGLEEDNTNNYINNDQTPEKPSLGDLNEERELARQKLFDKYNSNNITESTSNDGLSAREKLFGTEPKLPDYLTTNRNAERDARNYVDNFNRTNNPSPSFSGFGMPYSDPSPTRTPNIDNNILNNGSIRSSWGAFDPESVDDTRSIEEQQSSFDTYSSTNNRVTNNASAMFGFSGSNQNDNSNESDITFTGARDRGGFGNLFEPKGINALIPEEKPEPVITPERPKPKTKQTNIYDDAPKKYFAPPITLLKTYKDDNRDHSAEHKRKSQILNQVFESFKIPAQVSNVVRGPKFTRYEISLQIGIPVNKILQIEKNIEMALETDSGIRIEAPIPGKNAVGIEVKNDVSTTVGLRELLEAPEYINSKHNLPVVIGKNITGNIVVSSMDKMLHALVAGSTGSGKSVFIHSLIMSLLYKCSPDELKLLIIDPKQVDFVQYNGIPHLVSPEVFYSYEQAVNALTWSVKEMEKRYTFLREAGYSNIKDYNNSPKVKSGEEKKIPFIVIIVDEFSNLMSDDKNGTLEIMIKKVTEKARAAGLHMVVATQRPSVDVITGVIKNNLPTRVALTLASGVDSKTIINEVGAEKLLGYGDMLFAPQDSNKKMRLQGAYVSDDEIKSIINYIKSNNISSYDESIAEAINKKLEDPTEVEATSSSSSKSESKADQMDELMPKCLELVMARGKATTTMLQTKLSIGYSRAARIIGQMEERGFISDNADGKPREVYITQAQYDELFGNNN